MKSWEIIHITGGGIYLAAVVARGGAFDNSPGPEGTAMLHCSEALSFEQIEEVRRRTSDTLLEPIEVAPTRSTGYDRYLLDRARAALAAGGSVSVAFGGEGGQVLWTGPLGVTP